MKILMVNKYLYPRAGAETYMLYVSEQLKQLGHEIAFFGMEHPENTELGPCTTFPMLEFGPLQSAGEKMANLRAAMKQTVRGEVTRRFEELVETFQPDLIHAHNVYNQMSPALFRSSVRQIPVVMTVHDFKPICPNYSLFRDEATCTLCVKGKAWNGLIHRCCQGNLPISAMAAASAQYHRYRKTYQHGYHGFIAPSHFMRRRLLEGGWPEEDVRVIHNFAAAPSVVSPPGSGFLYAGRLCVEKGVDVLIRAYAKLPYPRPALTIAGTGPMEAELKALALACGCTEIEWTGQVSTTRIEELLEASAVSIVPSTWFENCSIVIMESLAHGRPCIVSDRGGNPELIEHERDGWVFAGGDEEALSKTLRVAARADPALLKTMGAAAAQSAGRHFSPDVHLQQLLEYYEIIRRQHSAA